MKYRDIGSLIGLILFFAIIEPRMFTIISVILIIGYLLISRFLIPFLNNQNQDSEQSIRRNFALNKARMFLSPYKNIWGDLKLSNKYCYLYLDKDGVTITGNEKVFPYRRFRILESTVHRYTDLWDLFCRCFSHNTTYDGLIEKCRIYKVTVYEYAIQKPKRNPYTAEVQKIDIPEEKQNIAKLDINNCSEIELTALPGISIVMAKKAIKKREEIGGFKKIEDFFLFMRLKPHMENQLREKICVKKMKISQKIKNNSERSVDL